MHLPRSSRHDWMNREHCSQPHTRGDSHEPPSTSSPEPARRLDRRPAARRARAIRCGCSPAPAAARSTRCIERLRVDVSRPDAARPGASTARARSTTASTARAYAAGTWRAELPARRAGRARRGRPGRCRGGLPGEPLLLRPGRRPDDRGPAAHRRRPASSASGPSCSAQRDASPTPTVSVAASDFYGPLVRNAHAGERHGADGAGRPRRCGSSASLDQPHSFTYVPDLAAAMIQRRGDARACGTRSCTRRPRPPVTQRELVEQVRRRGRRAGAADVGHPGLGA